MLKVLKFGGTSVGTLDRIANVAQIIKKMRDNGDDLIVVVSAMSGETNKLIEYSEYFSKIPNQKDMDILLSSGERVTCSLLSIALNEMGYPATAMSGRQAGIVTDDAHTKARISHIDTTRMQEAINAGNIIIVAGFQGITESGNVTTLGRGGSDLTAVAIAGAIKADLCEIFTDVDGIYTTDPRIEPKAKKLDKISYDEMLELASLGAKVLQNRSVEMAKKMNVNLISKSSFTPEIEGTLITTEENIMEKPIVSGIALDRNQARISLYGIEDKPGMAASIFTRLAEQNINVDMIVQTIGQDGRTNLDFTVTKTELEKAKNVTNEFASQIAKIDFDDSISKVSVVGVGMKSHSGVAGKAFASMAKENINILMISTSEIKVSMVIAEKYSELAVRTLHAAYNLDK